MRVEGSGVVHRQEPGRAMEGVGSRFQGTLNPKPYTLNSKLQTLNPNRVQERFEAGPVFLIGLGFRSRV